MIDQSDNDPARKRKKRLRTILRIGCWNITSLNNKDQEILMEIKRHKIDICALSETKKKGKGNTKYEDFIFIYSGKEKHERAKSGVGLMVHEKLKANIENVIYFNDRILQTSFKLQDTVTTHIISVYAPDITKPSDEKEAFYEDLQKVLDRIPRMDEVILLGDFNARVGNGVIGGLKNRFNEETINENGERLIQTCAQNELRVNNTYFPHKSQHKFTFENSRGQKSVIDYVITNKNIHPSKILDVRVLSSANTITGHNLVLAKIRNKVQRGSKTKPIQIKKLNIESLSDDSTRELYQRRLTLQINKNKIMEVDDVEIAWEKLKKNLIRAAEEALGRRKTILNGRGQSKPWFTQDVKILAEEKRTAYLRYRSSNLTYEGYKIIRNRVNEQIQAIKRRFWEKFSSDMEHDLYGAQKKVWNMLRNRKKPINEHLQITKISSEAWEQHFHRLYGGSSAAVNENYDADESGNYSIPQDKIRQTLGTLKNRKSPGLDEITNEMLKYGGDNCIQELYMLFNKVITTRRIPGQWKQSITIPIFKKGEKACPENYRGISLLSSVSKVFTKIISDEIASTGISEEQQGFRKNRSTIDAIFTIRQITEKAIEFNKTAFMCFIDLTQAFDRVRLIDIVRLLKQRKVDRSIIRVVRELNTDASTFIKTDSGMTKEIPIVTGIRQGDSLSPILFNIIMDEIIGQVKIKGRGYRMGNEEIKILCYADDAVIISEDEDNLQRLLYAFERAADSFNMIISTKKTQCLSISREPRRCKLAVYNKSIEQVMSYTYLGSNITSRRNLKEEVNSQITKASLISGYLRDIIWRNKYMSLSSKVRIYKTCVRPIMTYGIETRAENAETKRQLRTTEMRVLRHIAGYSLLDHKRNEEIRDICGIQDVVRWARIRRRNWRDHVDRMPDNRLPKIAKTKRPNTARLPGRPPKRWYESWTSASQE